MALAVASATRLPAQTNNAVPRLPPAPRRPSIILILSDNLGYGDLGCYGQTKIKTPQLDQLARDGIRFTSFYTGSPDDTAARAAWLTGLQPGHAPTGFNQPLPSDAPTVASFLKARGYHTGWIGEWGLGDTGAGLPDKKGFDEFAGFLSQGHAQDYFTASLWRHDPVTGFDGQMQFPENEGGRHGRFMPDLLTSAAVNFIHNNVPDQFNQHRPFFLCVAYPLPVTTGNLASPTDPQYASEPWPPLQRIRASLVSRLDAGVGQILDALDGARLATNTVVLFASVSGPLRERGIEPEFFRSAGPLRGGQGSVYEGGLRVPLLVRWPARVAPGRVSDLPCAAWDFLPTAAEVAMIPAPEKVDGISLLPTLTGKEQKQKHEVLAWPSAAKEIPQAVRLGDWKAVRTNATAAMELYNLRNDAGEQQNVAAQHPAEVQKLERVLDGRP